MKLTIKRRAKPICMTHYVLWEADTLFNIQKEVDELLIGLLDVEPNTFILTMDIRPQEKWVLRARHFDYCLGHRN